jgi:hypothetical protein
LPWEFIAKALTLENPFIVVAELSEIVVNIAY